MLGKDDLDDLASLGEVDTGAPDGTPGDPLDILDRPLDDESGSGGQLYLVAENGTLDRIGKDRFVIGRGKHCDFVINSGKVSREHAVMVRDEGAYFIEDLGSSNGTWFNKQRIKRRRSRTATSSSSATRRSSSCCGEACRPAPRVPHRPRPCPAPVPS